MLADGDGAADAIGLAIWPDTVSVAEVPLSPAVLAIRNRGDHDTSTGRHGRLEGGQHAGIVDADHAVFDVIQAVALGAIMVLKACVSAIVV